MREGPCYQQVLARPCWRGLLGALILLGHGPLRPAELRAQAEPPGRTVSPLPTPLPAPVGGENDPQFLSPNELQDSVAEELPRVPLSPRRPASGPGSVSSFVDSLKGNDAAFDVKVGQGRIL